MVIQKHLDIHKMINNTCLYCKSKNIKLLKKEKHLDFTKEYIACIHCKRTFKDYSYESSKLPIPRKDDNNSVG